jgi:hypothetical protein
MSWWRVTSCCTCSPSRRSRTTSSSTRTPSASLGAAERRRASRRATASRWSPSRLPKVVAEARKHFGCPTLTDLEVDESSTAHWEARLMTLRDPGAAGVHRDVALAHDRRAARGLGLVHGQLRAHQHLRLSAPTRAARLSPARAPTGPATTPSARPAPRRAARGTAASRASAASPTSGGLPACAQYYPGMPTSRRHQPVQRLLPLSDSDLQRQLRARPRTATATPRSSARHTCAARAASSGSTILKRYQPQAGRPALLPHALRHQRRSADRRRHRGGALPASAGGDVDMPAASAFRGAVDVPARLGPLRLRRTAPTATRASTASATSRSSTSPPPPSPFPGATAGAKAARHAVSNSTSPTPSH